MPRVRKNRRRVGAPDKLTRAQVYDRTRNKVYPPCKKAPSNIRMGDDIASDLGYEDNSKQALASTTNQEFGLVPPDYFTGAEMAELTLVRDHIDAICDKLRAVGRLDE